MVESVFADGDDVVTVDHGFFRETVSRPNLYFGWDPPNGSCDRGACDTVEYCDNRVSCESTDRSSLTFFTEVCPDDVVSGYHSGAVSAASRSDTCSRSGSGGYLV